MMRHITAVIVAAAVLVAAGDESLRRYSPRWALDLSPVVSKSTMIGDDPNCTAATKQKALYLDYTFEPALKTNPAVDISAEVILNSTKAMREYGHNGIYAAHPIGSAGGGLGGYFGLVVTANTSTGGLLFSVWDTRLKHMPPCQPNAPNATWCQHLHSFPYQDNGTCHRHCLDCGLHPGWRNTTGTQCSVPMVLSSGDSVTFRLQRTIPKITLHNMSGFGLVYHGSVWQVTARISTYMGNTSTVLVGSMFWEGSFEGIDRFGAFHEHVGCTPCNAFFESEIRRGPILNAVSRHPKPVHNISFDRKNVSCELYSVNITRVGSVPQAQFATGPGSHPNNDN